MEYLSFHLGTQLAAHLRRDLETLGLERRHKVKMLQEILSADQSSDNDSGNADHSNDDDDTSDDQDSGDEQNKPAAPTINIVDPGR